MSCYCRGFGLCDTCESHVCTGDCTCGTTPNHTTPEGTRPGTDAWAEKKELTS